MARYIHWEQVSDLYYLVNTATYLCYDQLIKLYEPDIKKQHQ